MDLAVRTSAPKPSVVKSNAFSSDYKSPAVQVVIPRSRDSATEHVRLHQVREVVCHRLRNGVEEYFVHWAPTAPDIDNDTDSDTSEIELFSWHAIEALTECLPAVQNYLERLDTERAHRGIVAGSKRKTPSSDGTDESPQSKDSSRSVTPLTGLAWTSAPVSESMLETALRTPRRRAEFWIQNRFKQIISAQTPRLSFRNDVDASTPPLRFRFISDHVYGDEVFRASDETTVGCGTSGKTTCRPDMGQGIGCEYSRLCECLEYAAVDTTRLLESEKEKYANDEVEGLPKRFPYFSPTAKSAGCLTPFYLNARHPIYECNLRCNCGPNCKTRLVQKGRQVPLEIFRTTDRGFGLRCLEALQEGQFIDTYRGEIITDAEADRREQDADNIKSSYLFELDKFVQEDCYVIDGEMMGGPTRFMNHSCEPNCRQFTVSYNKYDIRVYQIAFFATTDIAAGTELTFDYLDKDEGDNEDDEQSGSLNYECRCGSERCRKRLWL